MSTAAAATPEAKTNQAELTLDVIKMANEATAQLEKREEADEALRVKLASTLPTVTAALVAHGRIDPDQQEDVAKEIATHEGALQFITKLAAHVPAGAAGEFGKLAAAKATKPADLGLRFGGHPLETKAAKELADKAKSWNR